MRSSCVSRVSNPISQPTGYRACTTSGKKRPVRDIVSKSLPAVSLNETWVKMGVAAPSTVTVANTPSRRVGKGRLTP